jgi:hypothetical protein
MAETNDRRTATREMVEADHELRLTGWVVLLEVLLKSMVSSDRGRRGGGLLRLWEKAGGRGQEHPSGGGVGVMDGKCLQVDNNGSDKARARQVKEGQGGKAG